MADLMSSACPWRCGSLPMATCMPPSPPSLPSLLEIHLPSFQRKKEPETGGIIFMGGGPRTYPGGVTKWQWKRMQIKREKVILKARLLRERQMYEARRRAELMAATPALEMPWQKMSRFRPLNNVTADDQVKKLAARFQKDGAEDLWTENDGPERFEVMADDQSFTNALPRTEMCNEVDPFASNDSGDDREDDSFSYLRAAISGTSKARKFRSNLSENMSQSTCTNGEADKSSPAQFQPFSGGRWTDSGEHSFRNVHRPKRN